MNFKLIYNYFSVKVLLYTQIPGKRTHIQNKVGKKWIYYWNKGTLYDLNIFNKLKYIHFTTHMRVFLLQTAWTIKRLEWEFNKVWIAKITYPQQLKRTDESSYLHSRAPSPLYTLYSLGVPRLSSEKHRLCTDFGYQGNVTGLMPSPTGVRRPVALMKDTIVPSFFSEFVYLWDNKFIVCNNKTTMCCYTYI